MPIGIGLYLSLSRLLMTALADYSDTLYSEEYPPKITATFNLSMMKPFLFLTLFIILRSIADLK